MKIKLTPLMVQGEFIKIGTLLLDEEKMFQLNIECDLNNKITLSSNLSLIDDIISQWDNFVCITGNTAFIDNDKIIELHNTIKNDVLRITSSDEGILEFEKFLHVNNYILIRR